MVSYTAILLAAAAAVQPSTAFHSGRPSFSVLRMHSIGLRAVVDIADSSSSPVDTTTTTATTATKLRLDPSIAAQFTIQVCTSTSCTRKLNEQGLDQYHTLGEVYAQAQAANLEKTMIIEDGGCQGGKNCKMGPCVSILHEDYDGTIGLEGMNSNELTQRVFHNVFSEEDAGRVWGCVENAISIMAEEVENESD